MAFESAGSCCLGFRSITLETELCLTSSGNILEFWLLTANVPFSAGDGGGPCDVSRPTKQDMSADNAGVVPTVILLGVADPFVAFIARVDLMVFIALVLFAKVELGVITCRCSTRPHFLKRQRYSHTYPAHCGNA
ncbi:hypothetical protein BCR43DRAFT_500331 [Syncephalastrum racemosum]|uniref:Uncharacterized protein n=1 Tax=Syncephalastrum racemosum TaxID=13706 RepID=A0A1X2HRP6_SYNRA|nr:hypothetical protein BCR43DRAFT_500331 [Syncephalastrum racemosum]